MIDLYGIKPGISRARDLVANGDECSLRYACLELRLCMEMVAYRNLEQYGDVFPGNIAGEWKPDRIISALASFDPHGNMEATFEISPSSGREEDMRWEHVGINKPIPWKDFRKAYNKLGSYLHRSAPGTNSKALSVYSLDNVFLLLERVSESTAIIAIKDVICSTCPCGSSLYVGVSEFNVGGFVHCPNNKCNEIYVQVENEGGEKVFAPAKALRFGCLSCEAKVVVAVSDAFNMNHICTACGQAHVANLTFKKSQRGD